MSTTSSSSSSSSSEEVEDFITVDTQDELLDLLNTLEGLRPDHPSLFMEFNGINVPGESRLSVIALYVMPEDTVYLIDVRRLKRRAFKTSNTNGVSLKNILASPDILKVVCGSRDAYDAFLKPYHVPLRGIKDIQVIEAAARATKDSEYTLLSLDQLVVKDNPMADDEKVEWQETKRLYDRLFDKTGPDGYYGAFLDRPMIRDAAKYWARVVAFMPALYELYSGELRRRAVEDWENVVARATRMRMKTEQCKRLENQTLYEDSGQWDREGLDGVIEEWDGIYYEDEEEIDDENDDDGLDDEEEETEEENRFPKFEYMGGRDRYGRSVLKARKPLSWTN